MFEIPSTFENLSKNVIILYAFGEKLKNKV